jgi:hypothetical protein
MKLAWAALLPLALLPEPETRANGDVMPLTIEQVKAANEQRLLALPGVVSVGIGRDAQGRPVIVVGVDKPRPQTQAAVPRELDGYGVRVDIVGTIRAQ